MQCAATVDRPLMPLSACSEIFAGLDLSGRLDLTAYVLIGRCGEFWHVHPFFWTPKQGVAERARRDRAPYDMWVKQELIKATPGLSIKYEFVAKDIGDINAAFDVDGIAYDRWRMNILKKNLKILAWCCRWRNGAKVLKTWPHPWTNWRK